MSLDRPAVSERSILRQKVRTKAHMHLSAGSCSRVNRRAFLDQQRIYHSLMKTTTVVTYSQIAGLVMKGNGTSLLLGRLDSINIVYRGSRSLPEIWNV